MVCGCQSTVNGFLISLYVDVLFTSELTARFLYLSAFASIFEIAIDDRSTDRSET